MLKLDTARLTKALLESKTYEPLIEKSESGKYIFEELYMPLLNNNNLLFSDINFDAFTLEDLEDFEDYYDKTICSNKYTASSLSQALQEIPSAVFSASFL